jgi:hypothetical protein
MIERYRRMKASRGSAFIVVRGAADVSHTVCTIKTIRFFLDVAELMQRPHSTAVQRWCLRALVECENQRKSSCMNTKHAAPLCVFTGGIMRQQLVLA